MIGHFNRTEARRRIHRRIRRRVRGSAERPRLCVHFSGRHVCAQLIDDDAGVTLAAASTLEPGGERGRAHANCAAAERIGRLIGERAREKNIAQAVFDRGGFRYHGRVKALADAARGAGLQF